MKDEYHVTRAALEIQRSEPTPEHIEISAIDRQQRRFSWLSVAAIIVSFVHMAAALALFSGSSWYEQIAALAMTGLVDFATWVIAGYVDYAKRRGLSRSGWIKLLFGFALAISMGLNGAYLWSHRPAESLLPWWISLFITGTFALFIPMLIGVASLARGELEDDRIRQEQRQAAKHHRQPTIREVSPSASEKSNEVIPRPPTPQRYNTKSDIMTNDVPAILAALQRANVTRFRYAADIARCCGWGSSSSATKALAALRAAGVVRFVDGEYEVITKDGSS